LDWYEAAFRSRYLSVYRHRDDASAAREAAFLLEAAGLRPGDRVLDLACGAGRHARPLGEAGCRVTALDLSSDLLGEAAHRGTPRLARGDMRALPFADRAFVAAASFFTSFGYFEDEADDRRVLAEVSRVLALGGRYLLDFLNRETAVAGLVPRSESEVDGMTLVQVRWVDDERERIEKSVTLSRPGDADPVMRYVESVRLYRPAEIARMLEDAGFETVARHGDFEGAPFDETASSRLLVLARKP
jgi:ubiquinone/menaquinone biosynthesis C-methylase UbiE